MHGSPLPHLCPHPTRLATHLPVKSFPQHPTVWISWKFWVEGFQQVPLVWHQSNFSRTQWAMAVPSPMRSGFQPGLFLGVSIIARRGSGCSLHLSFLYSLEFFLLLTSQFLMTPTSHAVYIKLPLFSYRVVLSMIGPWLTHATCTALLPNSWAREQAWDSSGFSSIAFSFSMPPHRWAHSVFGFKRHPYAIGSWVYISSPDLPLTTGWYTQIAHGHLHLCI